MSSPEMAGTDFARIVAVTLQRAAGGEHAVFMEVVGQGRVYLHSADVTVGADFISVKQDGSTQESTYRIVRVSKLSSYPKPAQAALEPAKAPEPVKAVEPATAQKAEEAQSKAWWGSKRKRRRG